MPTKNHNPFEMGLDKNEANFVPLSPLTFLERAASVYPDHPAVIHGYTNRNWEETYSRCRRLSSALVARGVGLGDTVAVMAPNVPALFEAHFGVPMAGAVLNALNIRLDAEAIAFMLQHGEAKVLISDREFSPVISKALKIIDKRMVVIDIDDPMYDGKGQLLGEKNYEAFLEEGDPDFIWEGPADEWQAIALNYTSGTTGNPKGVVYHHRGAYLNGVSNSMVWGMKQHPIYLWTLPMFHCNGWCFPWTITATVGTHVCLRRIDPALIYNAIKQHGVTHFCAAPIILNTLINAPQELKENINRRVDVMTAGAAPPAAVIEGMESMGFKVTHVYGLTEVYGPTVVCAWHKKWDELPTADQARLKARQGVRYPMLENLMVADPNTHLPITKDGIKMGEIFMRGNNVMKGYLKNPDSTKESFAGGWFHTGDLAVWHEDGYIEIKDRSKDIIISGGENISTIEVEDVLYRHPAILEAAVVARPDEKWGETPCAFVALKNDTEVPTEEAIIEFCRSQLAHFKAPRSIVFGELPKTSTGKIQKYILREQAKAL